MIHCVAVGDEMFEYCIACSPGWSGRIDHTPSPDVFKLGEDQLSANVLLVTCPDCLTIISESANDDLD